jgi:uncharacterized membrane protein YkvA (DUF1232 family)
VRPLLVALGAAAAVYMVAIAALYLAGRRTGAREVATLLPNLLMLFKGLIRDPRVPRGSKVPLVFGAAWVASPIDLIPEFIPVIGPLDDAVVAALILRHLLRTAGRDVVTEHWRGDPETLARLLRLFEPKAAHRNPGRAERSSLLLARPSDRSSEAWLEPMTGEDEPDRAGSKEAAATVRWRCVMTSGSPAGCSSSRASMARARAPS